MSDAFPRLALTLAELTVRIPPAWPALRQWVAWRLEKRDGRWTKVPIDPRSGKRASSTDSTTWGTLTEAFAWHQAHSDSHGVGLMFAEGSGLVGIDLDHCIDDKGQLATWASEILTNTPSYAEISPSGTGVKLWALGPALPKGMRLADYPEKGSAVEMYSSGRYFTVTGNRQPDAPREVVDCAESVAALCAQMERAKKSRTKATAHGPVGNEKVSGAATPKATSAGRSSAYIPDDQIIKRAGEAKHGDRFKALWAGDWKAAGYGSQSEADLSLCGTLAFWAGPDASRVDSLFRRSGLMRPKWDEKHGADTYGATTVATALNGRTEFFTPWDVERADSNTAPLDVTIQVPAVRVGEELPELSKETVERCLRREEFGDAELFARMYDGRLLFDTSEKMWHLWRGHAWKADRSKMVRRLVPGQVGAQYLRTAGEVAILLEAENDPQKKGELKTLQSALIGRAQSLRKLGRTQNVLGFAESLLPTTGEDWDSDPWLLGVLNGVVDLRHGTLRAGNPADRIRTVCPTTWKGLNEAAPRFEQFMHEIMERANPAETRELVAFLHRLLGYGITGLSTEHILPVFWGAGRNGKDTVLDTMAGVLGSVAGPTTADVLVAESGRAGAAEPHLYDLRGKRLVWANETNEGARLNAGRVKWITGGGLLKARPLFGNPVEFKPTHLFLLITNHRPHAGADDYALWKRLALVPFERAFVEQPDLAKGERQKDSRLKERLLKEASGILAWLVRGCLLWQEKGLPLPACVQVATEQYRDEEDTLTTFVADCCVVEKWAVVSAKALYAAYQDWAGKGAMSQTTFGRKVGMRFERAHKVTGEVYCGLRLTADWAGTAEGTEELKGAVHKYTKKSPPSRDEVSSKPSNPSNPSGSGGAEDGDISERAASQAPPASPPCHSCGGSRLWRSIHGVITCGRCHPPGDASLVKDWIGPEPASADGGAR